MRLAFFRAPETRHRSRPNGVPRDLTPYQMRDIGLPPWPERPPVFPRHLW